MTGLLENFSQLLVNSETQRRLSELEHRVFKTARKTDTTKAQQILIFNELGLLDVIHKLDLPTTKKAKLLSILLNCSEENIKKDLQNINKKDSDLKTSSNYKFLYEAFKTVGLEKETKKIEIELDNILKKEDFKKNVK